MQVLITEKLDGISLSLVYVDGKLASAVTRGDGQVGDEITANAQHLRGVPQEIDSHGIDHIRGEVVLPFEDFEKTWKPKGKANPRNTVSGLCKGRSTPDEMATMQFVAYDHLGEARREEYHTKAEQIEWLAQRGFTTPVICSIIDSPEQAQTLYEAYDRDGGSRDNLPYLSDGLVVEVNSLEEQDRLSINDNRPEYAVAIKPSPKACITKVKSLEWSMGLSGRFSPVAHVEEADLDGTRLKKVSLHNLDQLVAWVEKGFGIGAEIMVIRSGDVIPYLTEIITPAPQ